MEKVRKNIASAYRFMKLASLEMERQKTLGRPRPLTDDDRNLLASACKTAVEIRAMETAEEPE